MEDVQKEIMGAGLNIAAICLYLFLGHSWCLVDYGSYLQDLVHIQGEHVLRGSITLCP